MGGKAKERASSCSASGLLYQAIDLARAGKEWQAQKIKEEEETEGEGEGEDLLGWYCTHQRVGGDGDGDGDGQSPRKKIMLSEKISNCMRLSMRFLLYAIRHLDNCSHRITHDVPADFGMDRGNGQGGREGEGWRGGKKGSNEQKHER